MVRNISKLFVLLLAAVSVTFVGCPDPLIPGGELSPGEMNVTASVEGNFYASDATVTGGSNYLVKASVEHQFPGNVNGHIEITLQIPKGTPPYTVSVGSTPGALIEYCLEESASVCTIYNAKQGTGSGTIRITSISPYLEGTFSGTLPEVGGSDSRSLSGGEFKAEFP